MNGLHTGVINTLGMESWNH